MNTVTLESLTGWGEEAVRSIPVTGTVSGKKTARGLSAALERIGQLARDESTPVWYADNEYLARREGGLAVQAFRRIGSLHATEDGALLVTLCRRFLEAGPLTEERLEAFLTGVRRTGSLWEKEAILTGDALRLAILEALAEKADTEHAAFLFTALRTLAELDMTGILERSDPLDSLLRSDEVYSLMDAQTRAMYRTRCRELAKAHGTDPRKEAENALQKGMHEVLNARPGRSGKGYIFLCFALTALLFCGLWLWSGRLWCALAALVPCHILVRSCIDGVLLRFEKPRYLPRLSLETGVTPEGRTVCAVFALLTADDTAPSLLRRLEEYRLVSRECGENLLFALVADLPEGTGEKCPEGEARLKAAAELTDALNDTYNRGFFLLTRDRVYSRSDGVYMPFERKRGAMLDLCRRVTGKPSALRCLSGDESALHAGYILCLDSDTRLLPGSARALIGAAMHPANRPVIKNGVVTKGHGLIHPRMSPELPHTLATDFSRLYAGQGGTDPYGLPSKELFFDRFSQGGFSGKGILDAEAYITCTAGFPENLILSHDAPEGAFLRGAYMGDTELSDTEPVTGAGWFRRLERWTRGDWQNLIWLGARGSRLPAICRFQLGESLARSLTAPTCLLCLVLSFCTPKALPAAAVALLCLGFEAVASALHGLFAPAADTRIRCRSAVLRGLGGAITHYFSRILFLPWEAFCTFGAILTALWRMTVTHRKLLRWSPAGERGKKLSPALVLSALSGALLFLLAHSIVGKSMGILWLFLPVFALLTAKTRSVQSRLTESDRGFLLQCSGAIWSYFTENCTRANHWLPPDNVQISPPRGAALRTSPTNIGMALASAVAASELGLAAKEEAASFIERLLSTVEGLQKWHGHLFNWYDITTCAPLQPPYVSAVDSGNLCACLLCAAGAMTAAGRDDLASRLRSVAEKTDFAVLYDEKRHLFRIGLDPVTGKPSPGHYDLMASEALLTSYLACAKAGIPVRHWQTLSRAQLSLDGWRGLASWSGSVFEYLMPMLFLPLTEGSALWESARFCVYAQRKRGIRTGAPWGASESGFYSLDASMDYRYKAHGVGALALRRDMNSELVVAPYAGFLSLCVHPKAAVLNLRRLKRRSMWGRYGFYEALDMTPGRCTGKGSPVASYMSHHLGMSLCAAANALKGGIMRQYFMAEPALSAYRCLLSERVPLGGPVLRRSHRPEAAEAPARTEHPVLRCAGEGYNPDAPAVFPLSNGVYSLLADTDGTSRAVTQGILLYAPEGFEMQINDLPILPSRRLGRFLPWRYEGGQLTFSATGSATRSCSVAVTSGETAELRRITGASRGNLRIRFLPVLAKPADYAAHPAFRRLGLEVTVRNGAVFVRRLARDGLPELWLCMAATVRLSVTEGLGWQMDAPVTVSGTLPEGGCMSLALCFGHDRETAYAGARRALSGGTGDMAGAMAAMLGMTPEGLSAAFSLCGELSHPRVCARRDSARSLLWRHGISGDLPIVYIPVGEDITEAKRMIKRHALLTACGVSFDLVLGTGEEADYHKPRRRLLEAYLEKYDLTRFLDVPGGIRFRTGEDIAAQALCPHTEKGRSVTSLPALTRHSERSEKAPVPAWHTDGSVSFDTPPLPPRAWCNILTNGHYGFLAADGGTGFSWFENAREFPVSPWQNDPLATAGGETLELICADGRQNLFADGKSPCRVVHGFGWTRWERPGITVTACVPPDTNARILLIEGGEDAFIGWHIPLALCANASDIPFVLTGCEEECLTACNPRGLYPDRVFRAVSNKRLSGFTCHEPSWLRGRLDGRFGSGLTPCFGALYKGGGTTVIVCGFEDVGKLRSLCEPQTAAKAFLHTRDGWRSILGRIRIRTPDKELDRVMNGWAAYQTLACRIMGRTSLYQNGGAFGFRDQLQDVCNLLFIAPGRAREHILTSCGRQFREGDVLHWWHETPEGAKGVRTRCSDDLLWLPWALCEYIEKTGDRTLSEETAPWLEAAPLQASEHDRYFAPPQSGSATVLEHARRALSLTLKRGTGVHGLLLTGSGDWNDGMDRVGGESVWLTWFFITVALRFDALLTEKGDPEAGELTARARALAEACERAWDGNRYLRGYWEDGTPLGAEGSNACAIDSLSQSWAAFCPLASRTRVRTALLTAYDRLYDPAHGITRLFAPPFGDEGRDPGYIRACGPGFRENGGQYTHGALWLASALLKEGYTEEGSRILFDLLPAKHPAGRWRTEPYVLAADVSANPDHYGQALWSWYTGSAGWFLRVVLEDLLGIKLHGGQLSATPRLPEGWEGYEATVAGRHITVRGNTASIE